MLIGCSAPPTPHVDRPKPYDTCQDSREVYHPGVLRVRIPGKVCTGVAISGLEVLTSAHCVEDDPGRVWVEAEGFRFESVHVAFRGPKGEDLALVQLEDTFISYSDPSPLVSRQPEIGAVLQLIGYGCDDKHTRQLMRRVVVRKQDYTPNTELKIEGCACHGDSGSPLFTSAGEVAGVNWSAGHSNIYAISSELVSYLRNK
jgi:S1-C subfamily serine protease